VKTRLVLRELPYQQVKQGSVLDIPYADNSFDVLFSHGVLHHVPDILTAQREIHRVLRPGGELIIMLYAKWSVNYLLSIAVVRRLGLVLLYFANREPDGIIGQHLANARKTGLLHYLRMENFIHRNTDGPLNPYSKVYDLKSVENVFPDFNINNAYKRFMHAPPLPVRHFPLEKMLGWHLWVHLKAT
jgi:SAM-dependent methyltransferase